MKIKNDNYISFNAKLGPNLKSILIKKELDQNNLDTFEYTFQKKFHDALEENTILEINKNGNFELKNPAFPKFKIAFKQIKKANTLSEQILQTNPLNYSYTEYNLFKKIISNEVRSGKNLDTIKNIADNKFTPSERREHFYDLIRQAKRIKKENPDSQLTNLEFSQMNERELRELLADTSNGIMEKLRGINIY